MNNNLAIAAVFQNEAKWLQEWLEFHMLVGVEKFILYNHFSRDNCQQILDPYVQEGIVDLIDWSYPLSSELDGFQCAAYDDALRRCKEYSWLALIDIDEFLVPLKEDLVSLLRNFQSIPSLGGLCIPWVFFGTSGVCEIPDEMLMIEVLVRNGGDPELDGVSLWDEGLFKSIVRPNRVSGFTSPHYADYKEDFAHLRASFELVQLNHYWTRDERFFHETKISRKLAWHVSPEECFNRAAKMDFENDFGRRILRFAEPLRKSLCLPLKASGS